MREIDDFIDNDEKILWKMKKNRNLRLFTRRGLINDFIINISIIFFFGFLYYLSWKDNNYEKMAMILFISIFIIISYNTTIIIIANRGKKERYSFFNQDKNYMKNYMEEDVLTTKKIIQKNYYNMYSFMKHIKNREKEGVIIDLYKLEGFKLIEDISILEINAISKVIVKWDYAVIQFDIKDFQDGSIIQIVSGGISKKNKAPIRECVRKLKTLIPSGKFIIE